MEWNGKRTQIICGFRCNYRLDDCFVEGERRTHVELYIPNGMGYGSVEHVMYPPYSTLIFNLRLEKVIHRKEPDKLGSQNETRIKFIISLT